MHASMPLRTDRCTIQTLTYKLRGVRLLQSFAIIFKWQIPDNITDFRLTYVNSKMCDVHIFILFYKLDENR